MRAYEYLQSREIIYNKRGVGFFVTNETAGQIINSSRKELMETELSDLLRRMKMLNIPIEILVAEYK